MKKPRLLFSVLRLTVMAVFALAVSAVNAQYVRTSYFMDGAQYRLQLNPALAPTRGYVHLPGVGHVQASMHSNSMGFDDVIEMIDNKAEASYFTGEKFYSGLKEMNNVYLNAGTDLLAVGWWQGSGFWSVNVGVKVDGSAAVPLEAFTFMREMKRVQPADFSDYTRHIGNEELNINAYTEIGVGYSRQLNDWLTVGGRVKGLVGLGNMNLKVHDAVVHTTVEGLDPEFDWYNPDIEQLLNSTGTAMFDVDADLECSFEGLDLISNEKGYIDDMNYKFKGAAGVGAAFDLGVDLKLSEAFSLSAAINDVGFIHWAKGCSRYAHSNTADMRFDTSDPEGMAYFAEVTRSGKVLNLDMLRLELDESVSKSRSTSLASTLAVGGEYRLMDNKLSLGVLYTNRFSKPKNESEITLSANLHPSSQVDLSVSYSPVLCNGKAFGVAVKVGPLFIGSDYVFMGKNNKCCNAMAGISIPLGKKPSLED